VRAALAIKGMQVEAVSVDVRRGVDEQHTKGFEMLNPARQVPVLEWEESGQRRFLGQSMAILHYLEAIRPTPALWPKDPYEHARATQLAELVNAGIQPLQNNAVLGRLEAHGVDANAWARAHIERGLAALETMAARGGAGRFLVGDAPTVADLFSVPQLYNARGFGVEVEEYETLAACEHECLSLPAFSSTHPDA
jgi:maleylpyruvate isomerase